MITWIDLRADDVAELRRFVCTDAPGIVDEGREITDDLELVWELEAQEGIQSIEHPLPRGEHVLIGRDSDGIVAVSWWYEVGGPSRVKLLVMAVALRMRGAGRRLGDQLLEETIGRLLERVEGTGIPCVTAFGLVHRRNNPSRDLFARHGFFYAGDDGVYREWATRVDAPPIE